MSEMLCQGCHHITGYKIWYSSEILKAAYVTRPKIKGYFDGVSQMDEKDDVDSTS